MRYVKPQYYDKFQCIADKCPDTCCAGWQIVIDEASLERYGTWNGKFRERMLNGIDWKNGSFYQKNGRCSMLNENQLCDMVTACGEESLCETCSRYPRHVEEFEGVREWSLSLSCPIAARMILHTDIPNRLEVTEDDEADPLEDEFEDFDFLLFTQLEDARNVLFSIAQNRDMPMDKRLLLILHMAVEMQNCVNEERLYDMDAVIASYEEGSIEVTLLSEQDRFRELQRHFPIFYQLEHLRDRWMEVITEAQEILFTEYAAYQKVRTAFLERYGKGTVRGQEWEVLQENLLVFFLYTYFCGAVYDDCLYSKAALSVFSVVFVSEFVMCRWVKEGTADAQDFVELAYRYAREVEHSDENLNMLEEWLEEKQYNPACQ